MDAALEASYREEVAVEFWAVEIQLSGAVLRLTTGGVVTVEGLTFIPRDPVYGTLSRIGVITDGAGDEAQSVDIELLPPSTAALAELANPNEQGGAVTVLSSTVDRQTGAVIGYEIDFVGVVNNAPLVVRDTGWILTIECVTEELRIKEDDEDKTLSPAFHREVWPGEAGLDNVTFVDRTIVWRGNSPSNSITGVPSGSGVGGGSRGGGSFSIPSLT